MRFVHNKKAYYNCKQVYSCIHNYSFLLLFRLYNTDKNVDLPQCSTEISHRLQKYKNFQDIGLSSVFI